MSRVRIKFCGMTRKQDIDYAIELGVDAIGMIFDERSPRAITPEKAKQLTDGLAPLISIVSVFVNPSFELVGKVINAMPSSILQFHGEESIDFCQQFNRPFIKAVRVKTTQDIIQANLVYNEASALLLDSYSVKAHGGTGETFDWKKIPEINKPYILAGGLNAVNCVDAVQQAKPYAIDVSSGVEQSPGIKDRVKMKTLIDKVWSSKQ
jgi:phosphoribosylanthranilate isomerase